MDFTNRPAEGMVYAAPKLTVYGAVADLTASGLTGSCETGNSLKNHGQCNGKAAGKPLKRG